MVLSQLSTSVLSRDVISFCCYVLRCINILSDLIYFVLVISRVVFMVVRVRCACITLIMVSVIRVWWYMFE